MLYNRKNGHNFAILAPIDFVNHHFTCHTHPVKIVYKQTIRDKMAIGYSFLLGDNIVETEDANFTASRQVCSFYIFTSGII